MTEAIVSIRPVVVSDLALFLDHEQDEQAIHMAAFTPPDPADRDAFMAHWDRLLGNETIIKRTVLHGSAVAGHVASWIQAGDRELTYWIDRAYWGRGVATAALRLFIDEVGMRPLYARVAADNVASRRVLEKNGFEVIGKDRGYANGRGTEVDELILRLNAP